MLLSDNYMLLSWAVALMLTATALYFYRARWVPALYGVLPDYAYHRLHPSFEADIEAGLSSDAFNLSGNVADGDSRSGLDEASKREILKIMKRKRVNFDEARRLQLQKKLASNGVGPDGRPTDPRAVFFS